MCWRQASTDREDLCHVAHPSLHLVDCSILVRGDPAMCATWHNQDDLRCCRAVLTSNPCATWHNRCPCATWHNLVERRANQEHYACEQEKSRVLETRSAWLQEKTYMQKAGQAIFSNKNDTPHCCAGCNDRARGGKRTMMTCPNSARYIAFNRQTCAFIFQKG